MLEHDNIGRDQKEHFIPEENDEQNGGPIDHILQLKKVRLCENVGCKNNFLRFKLRQRLYRHCLLHRCSAARRQRAASSMVFF